MGHWISLLARNRQPDLKVDARELANKYVLDNSKVACEDALARLDEERQNARMVEVVYEYFNLRKSVIKMRNPLCIGI